MEGHAVICKHLSHPQAKRQVAEEYPTYAEVPTDAAFNCDDKLPGYYADVDYQCQVRTLTDTPGIQYQVCSILK